MLVQEPIDVECSPNGAPVLFRWREVPYSVTSAPEPWFGREEWWQYAQRAARGMQVRFERECWRVDAVALRSGAAPVDGSFDLTRIPHGGWLLDQAWNDELESQLFW